MTVDFDIVIPEMVKKEDLADFFRRVYKDYHGNLFENPEFKLILDDSKIELRVKNNDFSELNKYGNRISLLFMTSGKGPDLRIFYPTSAYGHPTIRFAPGLIYSETEKESSNAQKKLEDILGFAKLLMKYSSASYFYAGFDVLGGITDPDTSDVQLIHCRANEYIRMLQVHVKNKFGVQINESQIERIVRETARIERENGFTTVYFFDIVAGGTYGSDNNRFYQAVKKLIGK